MSDPENPLDWVSKAEEDFQVARSILRRKNPLTATSSFHSQQCAEKYLKGILVSRQAPFPRSHDLLQLLNLCERAGVLIPIDPDSLDRLSKFAVAARYPGTQPTIQEAKEGLETAKATRKFARKFLNLK